MPLFLCRAKLQNTNYKLLIDRVAQLGPEAHQPWAEVTCPTRKTSLRVVAGGEHWIHNNSKSTIYKTMTG